MKVIIDPTRCTGHGTCAQLLTDNISLDKWHFPILERSKLREAHFDLAKRAVQLCPELAISIVEE